MDTISFFFKMTLFSSVLFLSSNQSTRAYDAKGKVQGIVEDTSSGQGIEYATVAIFHQSDSTVLTGTITDQEGSFILKDLPYGNYYLTVTCLGFDTETIGGIIIGAHQRETDIGKILLNVTSIDMDEVVISAERSPIEYHLDKDVMNVARNSNLNGGMAADVLGNHPAIETGLDGTVILRGSTNFIVLINGRPSANEGTDILRQISAVNIERIEIVTNPSAKYEANHASGIINIITNDRPLSGISGSISGSVSNAETYDTNISLTYGTKKIRLTVEGSLYHNPIFQDRSSVEKRMVDDLDGFQNFHSDNILLWEGKSVSADLDYFASKKNIVSVYISKGVSIFGWSPQKTIAEGTAQDTNYYFLDDYMRNYRDAWHLNISDTHRFTEKGHQVGFDANFIVVDMWRKNDQYLYHCDSSWEAAGVLEEYHLKRNQDVIRQQYGVDYSLPMGNDGKLETGILTKFDRRNIKNNIITQTIPENEGVSNNDIYRSYNHILAGYANFMDKVWKNDLQAGLRMEYADQNTILTNGVFNSRYHHFDLFPSMRLSRQFNDSQTLGIGFSRSIWRPTDLQLNPTVYFRDISGEFSGNANVHPSYTNQAELKYDLSFKESSLAVTGFYRLMTDNIMTIRYLREDNIYRNRPENLQGKQRDIGVELSGNFGLCKWLGVNIGGNIYHGVIDGKVTNQAIERRSNVWSARIIADLKPFDNTNIQANAYYNSPTLGDQVIMEEIYGVSFSVRQQLLNKNLSVNFSGSDIFGAEKRKFLLEGDSFYQRIIDVFPRHPVYALSITYKFNNFSKKQRENVEQGIGFF